MNSVTQSTISVILTNGISEFIQFSFSMCCSLSVILWSVWDIFKNLRTQVLSRIQTLQKHLLWEAEMTAHCKITQECNMEVEWFPSLHANIHCKSSFLFPETNSHGKSLFNPNIKHRDKICQLLNTLQNPTSSVKLAGNSYCLFRFSSRQIKYFPSQSYSLIHSICTNTLKGLYFLWKPIASTSWVLATS